MATHPNAVPLMLEDLRGTATDLQASITHLRGLFKALRVKAECEPESADALAHLILSAVHVAEHYFDHLDTQQCNVSDIAAELTRVLPDEGVQ